MQRTRSTTPRPPRRRRFALASLILATLATVGLLELAVRGMLAAGLLAAPRPAAGASDFWLADAERFGVWHRPDAAARHATDCFDVAYRTNSVGARDVERSRSALRPRVVVLGDSFVEGWGIPREQRLSDLLERATGLEHLNFGMAHFGPYQSYLVYRELAKRYAHANVLLAFLPNNDFFDLDYELARRAPSYEYRYRPYLVGDYPEFREVRYREPTWQRWLRRHSALYNAAEYGWHRVVRGGDVLEQSAPELPGGLIHSFYYDFTERQFELLRFVVERLVAEAAGKHVALVLIPVHRDFLRYHQSGDPPLSRRLRQLGAERGFVVVDLLPAMYGLTPNWNEYFYLPCDYHWSPLGNAVAARLLVHELRGGFYDGERAGGRHTERPGP